MEWTGFLSKYSRQNNAAAAAAAVAVELIGTQNLWRQTDSGVVPHPKHMAKSIALEMAAWLNKCAIIK